MLNVSMITVYIKALIIPVSPVSVVHIDGLRGMEEWYTRCFCDYRKEQVHGPVAVDASPQREDDKRAGSVVSKCLHSGRRKCRNQLRQVST